MSYIAITVWKYDPNIPVEDYVKLPYLVNDSFFRMTRMQALKSLTRRLAAWCEVDYRYYQLSSEPVVDNLYRACLRTNNMDEKDYFIFRIDDPFTITSLKPHIDMSQKVSNIDFGLPPIFRTSTKLSTISGQILLANAGEGQRKHNRAYVSLRPFLVLNPDYTHASVGVADGKLFLLFHKIEEGAEPEGGEVYAISQNQINNLGRVRHMLTTLNIPIPTEDGASLAVDFKLKEVEGQQDLFELYDAAVVPAAS